MSTFYPEHKATNRLHPSEQTACKQEINLNIQHMLVVNRPTTEGLSHPSKRCPVNLANPLFPHASYHPVSSATYNSALDAVSTCRRSAAKARDPKSLTVRKAWKNLAAHCATRACCEAWEVVWGKR